MCSQAALSRERVALLMKQRPLLLTFRHRGAKQTAAPLQAPPGSPLARERGRSRSHGHNERTPRAPSSRRRASLESVPSLWGEPHEHAMAGRAFPGSPRFGSPPRTPHGGRAKQQPYGYGGWPRRESLAHLSDALSVWSEDDRRRGGGGGGGVAREHAHARPRPRSRGRGDDWREHGARGGSENRQYYGNARSAPGPPSVYAPSTTTQGWVEPRHATAAPGGSVRSVAGGGESAHMLMPMEDRRQRRQERASASMSQSGRSRYRM